MYAGLQATLHNAHFQRDKSEGPYTPDMWMPGYVPPSKQDNWKSSKRAMMMLAGRATKETRAANRKLMTEYHNRVAQVRELPPGATKQQIMAIMRG